MAGIGPAPKDPSRLAGHGAAKSREAATKRIQASPSPQPELPEGVEWPARTVEWWQIWAESPLSAEFTSTDWDFLLDTALLHARVWGQGDMKLMAELRLRVSKLGCTPEDRARLRIQFVAAEEAEKKSPSNFQAPRTDRYQGLRAVGKSSA
ncbi:hypothetical protein R2325_13980 [Mycobacteroides chelonae]|nr:hypothetical protein [Mycobacteroides chelonae]MEC4873134.1 hypothetical protein [Mycobacteroides chelonae]